MTDKDGLTSVISAVTFDYNYYHLPAGVQCPLVAEPGIDFSCSFASVGGNADSGLAVQVDQTDSASNVINLGTATLKCKRFFF